MINLYACKFGMDGTYGEVYFGLWPFKK
jgi:hypothetical protein